MLSPSFLFKKPKHGIQCWDCITGYWVYSASKRCYSSLLVVSLPCLCIDLCTHLTSGAKVYQFQGHCINQSITIKFLPRQINYLCDGAYSGAEGYTLFLKIQMALKAAGWHKYLSLCHVKSEGSLLIKQWTWTPRGICWKCALWTKARDVQHTCALVGRVIHTLMRPGFTMNICFLISLLK